MKDEIKEILDNLYRFRNEDNKFQPEDILTIEDVWLLLDYITNLQEENEFLKLNNPEMNIEHFRIIKENKRKIDNLRKENERLTAESTEWESKFYDMEDNFHNANEEIERLKEEVEQKNSDK